MAEILLKELSNADLDWLIAAGERQTVSSGTVLLQSEEASDVLYLLLDGSLTVFASQSVLSAANNGGEQEVARLTEGDIIGETLLFNLRPLAAAVKAVEDSIVLSIPQSQLIAKLHEDCYFSAHFHRAIALLVAERLRRILEMPSQLQVASSQPVKEAIFVFGEMRDSDVDWLVAAGHIEKLAAGQILIQSGRPLDALYIILDGSFSLAVSDGDFNPLTHCFECEKKIENSQTIIEYLSRGEMSGAISFLDFRPTPITVKAVKESLVLSVSRQQLMLKLQEDMGFAARFYRVLAIQLVETWQTVVDRLNTRQQTYNPQQDMDEVVEYDDELDLDSLHQVAQGAARFNWMLKRLGVV